MLGKQYPNAPAANDLSELDTYLREPILEHGDNFDLLQWWKLHSRRFPTLYRMAKHFFSVWRYSKKASSAPDQGRQEVEESEDQDEL